MNSIKKIQIFEYNLLNKTIKLTKKEIKDESIGDNSHFNSIFDNENGNVMTKDNKDIIVWKKEEKK